MCDSPRALQASFPKRFFHCSSTNVLHLRPTSATSVCSVLPLIGICCKYHAAFYCLKSEQNVPRYGEDAGPTLHSSHHAQCCLILSVDRSGSLVPMVVQISGYSRIFSHLFYQTYFLRRHHSGFQSLIVIDQTDSNEFHKLFLRLLGPQP